MSVYRDVGFERYFGITFLSEELKPYLRSGPKKPLHIQLVEMLRLYRTYRYPPYQYIKHGLYKVGAPDDYLDFVPQRLVTQFMKRVNPQESLKLVEDKVVFRDIMERCGLPCVREILRRQADGRLVTSGREEISKTAAMDLLRQHGPKIFVKETLGMMGKGAMIIDVSADQDDPFDLPGDLLFQPIIHQHPKLQELFPYSVNTVRIDTLKTDSGYVNNGAVLRMGCNRSHVDNWDAGGLIVRINMETGRLFGKGKQKVKFGGREFDAHPDTGVIFSDFQIPFWPDILDVVGKGAEAMAPLGSLGWDVAVTSDGPVLVEANEEWDVRLFQDGLGGLARTKLGELVIQQHLGKR
jgi:Sugar-transfer associated ATP-grasp